jgi:hypothetical protein
MVSIGRSRLRGDQMFGDLRNEFDIRSRHGEDHVVDAVHVGARQTEDRIDRGNWPFRTHGAG